MHFPDVDTGLLWVGHPSFVFVRWGWVDQSISVHHSCHHGLLRISVASRTTKSIFLDLLPLRIFPMFSYWVLHPPWLFCEHGIVMRKDYNFSVYWAYHRCVGCWYRQHLSAATASSALAGRPVCLRALRTCSPAPRLYMRVFWLLFGNSPYGSCVFFCRIVFPQVYSMSM